ncbi:MAG: hypothetical protein WCB02_23210 [Bradyrhizobium sp.]
MDDQPAAARGEHDPRFGARMKSRRSGSMPLLKIAPYSGTGGVARRTRMRER